MNNENPVIVTDAGKGSPIELKVEGEYSEEIYRAILKQGDRYASIVGDLDIIMSLDLEVGKPIMEGKVVYGTGRIVVQDQYDPIVPEDPLCMVKMKNGQICRKNGRVIYSSSFFTYNPDMQDYIIEED